LPCGKPDIFDDRKEVPSIGRDGVRVAMPAAAARRQIMGVRFALTEACA
jgi:hypothetical protein